MSNEISEELPQTLSHKAMSSSETTAILRAFAAGRHYHHKNTVRQCRSVGSDDLLTSSSEPTNEFCVAEGVWRLMRDFSLVLASQNIIHTLSVSEQGPWGIFVPPENVGEAEVQIALYKQENPEWERETEFVPLPILKPSTQPLWFLAIPAICTLIQFSNPHIEAFGVADAARILKGEWWRLFTAQTLHASNYHLVSNLISGFFVFSLMSFRLPLSRIAPFVVLAASAANLETALVMKNYFSLGFSTTVFAGLGALAVLETRASFGEKKKGVYTPVFAAFLLAVFVGVGDETSHIDILGHFFGFIMGAFAGFVPSKKTLTWGVAVCKGDVLAALALYAFFACVWKIAL